MEWSNECVLQLIEAYRLRPVLWNPLDSFYKNKNKKEDAWKELADILKTDSAEIKKKMQSLLASFRREKQKLKTTSGMGTEEVYDTKWFAFKSLLFLKDRNQPVQTQDTEGNNENESAQDEDLEDNTDRVNRDMNETNGNESNAVNVEPIRKRKEFVSPKKLTKKRTKTTEDPRVADAYAVITDLKSNISAQIKDGCSAYGEHIAFKLRTYNSYTQAVVQHHINNIIFNADMGLYAQPTNVNIQLPITTHSTGYYSSPASSPAALSSSHLSSTPNLNTRIPVITTSTGYDSSPASFSASSFPALSSSHLSSTPNLNTQIPITTSSTGYYFSPASSPAALSSSCLSSTPSALTSPTEEQVMIIPQHESFAEDPYSPDETTPEFYCIKK